ncbi:MAG: glutamate formimidoyltransferase [Acidimicrobiales bacterium]
MPPAVLECVVNVSEGRDPELIAVIVASACAALLDLHSDPGHNRSVVTLGGPQAEEAARAVATTAVELLDIGRHAGAHPRLGVVDVVPFVPLGGTSMEEAVAARDRFAAWAGSELGLPCFLYGPERSLPEVRRQAFAGLEPATGPRVAHPTAGAACVGARAVLVAYNLWLVKGTPVEEARRVAAAIRGPEVRALGLRVGEWSQVSMNLVEPAALGPAQAYDLVAALAPVERAELVGLVPASVLTATPAHRREELDLDAGRTIEARMESAAAGW